MAKICGVMLLFLVGCGKEVVVDVPEQKPVDVEAFIASVDTQARALATTLAAQKLTGEQTLETAQAIMAKLNTLEASLVVPKVEPGKEVIESAPNPPAKANTQQTPLKVATPGDFSRIASDGTRLKWDVQGNWNPTILETSAHLREHGIDTNGMTHQEMADIHAGIHEGKQMPVSAVRVKNASPVSNCPGGTCPTNRTQRRRGLFGGLFR